MSSGCYLHFSGFAACWSSRVRSEMVTPSLSVFPSGREHCCPLMSCSPGMVELKVVGREQKTVQVEGSAAMSHPAGGQATEDI